MDGLIEYVIRTALSIAIGALATGTVAMYRKNRDRVEDVQQGLLALMRDRMVQQAKYFLHEGYMPLEERESFDSMFKAYVGLGGNGVVKTLHDRVVELPYGQSDKSE